MGIKWNAAKEWSDLTPDKKIDTGLVMIIIFLVSVNFIQYKQREQDIVDRISLGFKNNKITSECDSQKMAMMRDFDSERKEWFKNGIEEFKEEKRIRDSSIREVKSVRIKNKQILHKLKNDN